MGLEGISVNQLRVTQENNSAELNSTSRFALENTHKVVDGLSQGQKVDPDKENEHGGALSENYNSDSSDNDEENQEEEEVVKYDLSDSSKYILKVDEDSNNILIMEKSTSNVVQTISADELSRYVGFLSSAQGSIVNRKF